MDKTIYLVFIGKPDNISVIIEKSPRAKTARQSWEVTRHQIASKEKGEKEAILSNYLSGRQLLAGLEAVKLLEEEFVKGNDYLGYNEFKKRLIRAGNSKRTIEEALLKLKQEGIVNNTERRLYSKRRYKRNRKTPKRSSMAGNWMITWKEYANRHRNFLEVGLVFDKLLEDENEK